MTRIDRAFAELKKKRKKAFIAFITAGYPDLATTEKLLLALPGAGVDLIELGIPFSDPLADGPIIQEASRVALEKGTSLKKVLEMVARCRTKISVPVCFMSYYNPIMRMGEDEFIRRARSAGVDGLIVPDLPFEEAKAFASRAGKAGVELISFVSPTTEPRRLKNICASAGGFIYYVSLTGVTGLRQKLPAGLARGVEAARKLARVPVCVGFGVSSPAQVRQVSGFSDGVIVGSAIVRVIRDSIGKPGLERKVIGFVRTLTRAS